MRILQINTVYPKGSTGKIAHGIHNLCLENNIKCVTAYRFYESREPMPDSITISSWLDCHIHNRISSLTMLQGIFSRSKTKSFIKWLNLYNPDIIHLHNIHGSYLNHKLLFNYIKKKKIKVIWTLHDCWAFTGGCPHFTMIGCNAWQKVCKQCPQKDKQIIDTSQFMHKLKKKLFSGLDMTIVTPSHWLANLVNQSFLNSYPVKVINNGIDLSIFKPTEGDFRTYNNIPKNKFILLGVAFDWGKRKGIDIFVELAQRLNPENFQIVLIGTDANIDTKLPPNILSIHRTPDQVKLAEVYSAADLFINPTREDTYPTVNMEALACGTPVLTFRTGGSSEILDDTCGSTVACDDIDALEDEIVRISTTRPYSEKACISRATAFDQQERFKEYIALYESLIHI